MLTLEIEYLYRHVYNGDLNSEYCDEADEYLVIGEIEMRVIPRARAPVIAGNKSLAYECFNAHFLLRWFRRQ